MDSEAVAAATRRWVETFVIGLGLCPFARKPAEAGLIRYAVTGAATRRELLDALAEEMNALAAADPAAVETTLLIHPNALADFLDYNDFLADADRLVAALGFEGVFQIASFHPQYRFADAAPDAAENYTNRSPYPILHLLREDSITRVAGDAEFLAGIPRRNIAALRALGVEAIRRRLA